MNLVYHPDPILKQVCTNFGGTDFSIIHQMMTLMFKSKGVGLAAPQVGKSWRLFVTGWGEVFIDPKITAHSETIVFGPEGCLSIPGTVVEVPRFAWVRVNRRMYRGLSARIIQHELDHLNGKLITDYQ